jgi:hypothetical protein
LGRDQQHKERRTTLRLALALGNRR